MLTRKEILNSCIQDYKNIFGVNKGWFRRNHFDLLIKYLIFIANCVGRNSLDKVKYIFVDEVNNSSMSNNLKSTYEAFLKKVDNGENISYCSFYRKSNNSIKLGYLASITELFMTVVVFLGMTICSIFNLNTPSIVMDYLIGRLCIQIRRIKPSTKIYLASDHHFFSSIIAMSEHNMTYVLQHGLIMNQRFYYPIRADVFLAWGEHSREIQHYDEKVKIVGTYKFGMTHCIRKANSSIRTVVFCINSFDENVVRKKIDILYEICCLFEFDLMVKCHPGSLYSKRQWVSLYKGKNIRFYKEELLKTLSFDLAITENSTAIIDLIVMGKPFILFDNIDGYFAEYNNLIPHGNTMEEILNIVKIIHEIDFNAILDTLTKREINHCIPQIDEMM